MLVTKAIREPSGEKLGVFADPTFAINATARSTSSSAASALCDGAVENVEANAAASAKANAAYRVAPARDSAGPCPWFINSSFLSGRFTRADAEEHLAAKEDARAVARAQVFD